MAFNAANFTLMSHGNGFRHYRYDTLDAISDVDANGYINNTDDAQNLVVGDTIDIVVWATAIRTGTISDFGKTIVMQVAAGGDVDCSTDIAASAPATGD